MEPVTRRLFLMRSSLVAAAAGALTTVPGLAGVFGATATDAPALDDATTMGAEADAGEADLTQPLVAHVKDLSTGEISLFSGTREFVTHDPQLASRLFRAAR